MLREEPVVAWVVDDTGFPKKGHESARQDGGQMGKPENCRVAVSLAGTTEKASMPIAFRLYLPEAWTKDRKRRKKTGVPEAIGVSDQDGHRAGTDQACSSTRHP